MKTAFPLFFGSFIVMALSNAIVPVLPAYSENSSVQGAIYAAYFLGAFLSTLPGGMLSDRFGRVPLIRSGLLMTAASGIILCTTLEPGLVLAARFTEGTGAGCFVAAAMSYVNSRPDHRKMSGYYMAFLNAGLVSGLLLGGWLAAATERPTTGILLFTALALIPAGTAFLMTDAGRQAAPFGWPVISDLIRKYSGIWVSAVILIGITGVVSSLYPRFSGASPGTLGYWMAGMSVATIVAVLAASRTALPPVPAIRWSAILMAAATLFSFFSPGGFIVLGILAGIVMIAQMVILSGEHEHQGVVMGLFSTASYLGMALLPFAAGLCADIAGFFIAFCLTAFSAALVTLIAGESEERSATG